MAATPGRFCWAELATDDREGAEGFYSELLGWSADSQELPDGSVYTMMRTPSGGAGGVMDMPAEMRAQGVPPNWLQYVSVQDVEASAARAAELGGAVIAEPFDVMSLGRMAVVADPAGGVFALWQPGDHEGYDADPMQPGGVVWHELNTRDAAAARPFYEELFGWGSMEMPMPGADAPYVIFTGGEDQVAGLMPMGPEFPAEVPSHWRVYFAVSGTEAATDRAAELGGTVTFPPMESPYGTFAGVADPSGAHFSVITPQTPPS
jgi:hypothetical protein